MRSNIIHKSVKTVAISFISAWVIISIFPIFWALLTSLKPPIEVASMPPKLLFLPDFSNYKTVLFGGAGGFYSIVQEGFWRFLMNSFVISTITTILTLFLGTMSSYYIARVKLKSDRLRFWFLSLRMMPPIAIIIPFYIMMKYVGLVDSKISLILIYTIFNLPLTVWFVSSYIRTIPIEYDQMAAIDGFSKWSGFLKVIVPMSKPAIITSALLVFIFSWNEFLFALILTGFKSKTLPVLATGFITQRGIIWGQLTATAIIIIIPIFIMTLIAQRYLSRGMTLGIKR